MVAPERGAIDSKTRPDVEKKHKFFNKVYIGLILFFTTLEGVMLFIINSEYFTALRNGENENFNIKNEPIKLSLYMVALSGQLLLLISTAIIQLKAVLRFRNILRNKNSTENVVNLRMLYLHAAAFGLFIFSEFFYMALTFMISIPWRPYYKHDKSLYIFGGLTTTLGTFFAQAMI